VRKFRSEQIKDQELIQVLEAGTWAPTSRGAQHPHIIAVQNPEFIERLVKMNAEVMETTSNPYYDAPTIILVLTDRGYGNEVYDGSIVLQTMMLAAHEVGLATCWIHREKEMFDSEEGQQLLRDMGIQDNLMGIGALSIGYEAEGGSKAPKPRKADYYKIIK
jgi:nitroreductase